jgi:AraC-like DNA-binding protein
VPSLFYKAICRIGRVTSDFDFLFKSAIEGVWKNAESLHPSEHGAALNSILSLCTLTSPFRDSAREIEPCIRVTKAMNFIEDNLGEEWLNPQSVADAQGVSRRYLDERFGLLGLRIERWIWERRLMRARDELSLSSRAGRNSGKTVIQVALDNGFKSPSHFSGRSADVSVFHREISRRESKRSERPSLTQPSSRSHGQARRLGRKGDTLRRDAGSAGMSTINPSSSSEMRI